MIIAFLPGRPDLTACKLILVASLAKAATSESRKRRIEICFRVYMHILHMSGRPAGWMSAIPKACSAIYLHGVPARLEMC